MDDPLSDVSFICSEKLLHLVLAVYDLNSLRCLVRLTVCVPNHVGTSQAINRDLGHSRL